MYTQCRDPIYTRRRDPIYIRRLDGIYTRHQDLIHRRQQPYGSMQLPRIDSNTQTQMLLSQLIPISIIVVRRERICYPCATTIPYWVVQPLINSIRILQPLARIHMVEQPLEPPSMSKPTAYLVATAAAALRVMLTTTASVPAEAIAKAA